MASYIQFNKPNPTDTYTTVATYAAAITAFVTASTDYLILDDAIRKSQPSSKVDKPNDFYGRQVIRAIYGRDFENPTAGSNTTYRDMFCEQTGERLVLVKKAFFNTLSVVKNPVP